MTTTSALSNLVYLANNQPMTDSRRLAEGFGMDHKNVMRKIDGILSEAPDFFSGLNFEHTSYTHEQNGQKYQSYSMTRDGFMHIALTFTGKKGNAFRVAVIEQINKMERQLVGKQEPLSLTQLLQLTSNRLR